MRRIVAACLLLCAWIGVGFFVNAASVFAESDYEIALLDQAGAPVVALVDGNTLRITLATEEVVEEDTVLSVFLDRDANHLGDCRVPAGERNCTTAPIVTLGWYWGEDGTIRPRRQVFAIDYAATGWTPVAAVDVSVHPRPVVMVHGLTSSYATWLDYLGPSGFLARTGVPGFAVGDGQAPGAMHTGNVLRPAQPTNTIAQNAQVLADYMDGVKEETGAEQVDLVVHSMGGLISRYYIDRLMGQKDVAQLIMLGTPNGGSDCAVLAGTLGFYQPASLELRTAYLRDVFNPQIVERKGTPFYMIAGVPIQRRLLSPCGEVPNDLVVSLQSAMTVPSELVEYPLMHNDLNASEELYLASVAPLLRKSSQAFARAPISLDDAETPVADVLQFSQILTGTVSADADSHHTIHIDRDVAVASFGLFDPTRSLTVTVRGATGNVITLSAEAHGLTVVTDPESLVYLGYGFDNPRPGPWEVTLHATERTPPLGAEYALVTLYEGGAAVNAALSNPLPSVGQAVAVTATLQLGGEPIAFDRARATWTAPDGAIQDVPVTQSGEVLNFSVPPAAPGVYGLDVTLGTTLDDGTVAERTVYLAFEALVRSTAVAPRMLLR